MILKVEKLSKSFGGLLALNRVSFQIEAGETVGLIGPNGSGKSTVFNVVTGFLKPNPGAFIEFEGANITALPPHEISRRGIARTFQLVKPFLHLTALQNIMVGRAYGCHPAKTIATAEADARTILTSLGLGDKARVLARDLTVIERKRLELGRALAAKPRLLLLDEFMAGLNPVEVQAMMKLLAEIKATGITLVIVEHIVKAIMGLSDRIIVLSVGQKIAEGPPAAIVAEPEVIAAYLGSDYAQG
jgi:branched-chain amino acid transport system ATP-binding protein